MFNQLSTHKDSLKFASEAELFKQHQTSKYLWDHAPEMDRPLKETSPASLEKHLKGVLSMEWSRAYIINYGISYMETAPP